MTIFNEPEIRTEENRFFMKCQQIMEKNKQKCNGQLKCYPSIPPAELEDTKEAFLFCSAQTGGAGADGV